MDPILISTLILGVIKLLGEVTKLLSAKTEAERDAIMVAARAQRRALDAEIDVLADAAQSRIDARRTI